ncbi:MAG TPA: hypothetical protein VFV52_08605 [Bacilli bacterium]|nr:hypothetical protein [Bacilli bacterium]
MPLLFFAIVILVVVATWWSYKLYFAKENLPALENGLLIALLAFHGFVFYFINQYLTLAPDRQPGNGNFGLLLMFPEAALFLGFAGIFFLKTRRYLSKLSQAARWVTLGFSVLLVVVMLYLEISYADQLLTRLGETSEPWYSWYYDPKKNGLYGNGYTFLMFLGILVFLAACLHKGKAKQE